MTKEEILKKADTVLNKIRPHLAVDGGNIEVVDYTIDKKLLVKLLGNCSSCSMSNMTLKGGVQEIIHHEIPEITSVEAIE
jgi:Fe-S cluster biogenesis protein NfuA